METGELGICYKIKGMGYRDVRPPKGKRSNLHSVKSIAGTDFHLPFVESTCVYDENGIARLYLKKTANGVHREERDADGNIVR